MRELYPDYPEESDLDIKRNYPIFKSNDLIQKSRYALSLTGQKTVAYICSLLQEHDPTYAPTLGEPWRLEYTFDIREYCQVCGFDYDSGNNYAQIKATLLKLASDKFWIENEETITTVGWLSKATINKRSGKVTIKLDEDMVPYLFGLKKQFTRYELINVLGMKSAYSIRLYELLKSYAGLHEHTFSLQEFKVRMGIENIKTYNEQFSVFRKRVLETAVNEINRLTDLEVQYLLDRSGRGRGGSVKSIKFIIHEKDAVGRWKAAKETKAILDGHVPGQTKLDLDGVEDDEW